jgi:hypothetical protein
MTGHEFINDFLYFVVRADDSGDTLLLCSGINLDRFMPIIRGRCGIGGNPILSGLKLVNFDICARAISLGAIPRMTGRTGCSGLAPTDETWHGLTLALENAAGLRPDEIVSFAVSSLAERIAACSLLKSRPPVGPYTPDVLQNFLEKLCAVPEA